MTGLDPARRERLREALEEGTAPPADCASPEELWSAVRGELPARRAAGVLGHAAACARCGEALRLAREIAAGAPPDAAPLRAGPAPLRLRWPVFALAAAAGLLVAVPLLRSPGPPPAPAALRGQGSAELVPLLPEGAIPRRRALLRWSPAGEGARYTVTVATRDLTPLFTASNLAATELLVPEEALSAVPPGGEILWTVEARLADGRRAGPPAFVSRVE
jgi:hypothetical protein